MGGGPVLYNFQETWAIMRNGLKHQGGAITTSLVPFAKPPTAYRGNLSWRDKRVNSGWQASTLTPSTYRSHFSPTSALFQLPAISSLSLAMDFMHCHHLGWLQYLYGSILHLLVFFLMPGEHLINLAQIGQFIKNYQKQTKQNIRTR